MTKAFKPVHITRFKWIDPKTIPPRSAELVHRTSNGFKADDGLFDYDDDGPLWLEFDQWFADGSLDTVYWCPATDDIATFKGKAFCLGAAAISDPTTYALDGYLHIHATPGRWVKADGKGIYVVDWKSAFDRLRDAPRIAIDPEIEKIYHRHMKPARMPKVTVRRYDQEGR